MSYFDDANELVLHGKQTLDKIKSAYEESLNEQTIKKSLLIEIKNFMENLRSALDYSAHGLYDKYGDKTKKADKIYFPYAWTGLDNATFNAKKVIEQKIPGLTVNRPDIGAKIESYQHFASADNSWLPKFMELNNENKHQKLTPQTRKEIKELKITSGNVGMSIKGNAGIRISGNASIRIGNAIITGNQNINPNNPAIISGQGKQEIITWVSFHFTDNNEPVYPLLTQALNGIEKIVTELSKL
ncbi:MAG TPA: hypothetical protein VF868_00085 [Bacteroidia bacterium]|jgi:hypothetical protein